MTEKLLQYIWQFQYFNKSALTTANGERLEIIFPGQLNLNQGPDFSNAKIKIDGTTLVGAVELHLKTSQWKAHGHENDPNYKTVVLHVVFENDHQTFSDIPLLELQPRISNLLLQRYQNLMEANSFISCAPGIAEVKEITWTSWKERLLAERLTRKSNHVFELLQKNNYHWEETFWWMLARNFGTKVNGDAFEAIAQSVSINLLAKHKNQIHQIEALLIGQANLLNGTFIEDYPQMLQREYYFMKKKYGLKPVHIPVHLLRMRPGNFPVVRLAQLAMLIHNSAHLFSKILEAEKVEEIKKLFSITANDYWHYHYTIDEPSGFRQKSMGIQMIDNVIINTVVPVLFAYGLYNKEEKYKSKATNWLDDVSAEANTITKGFQALKLSNKKAYDSQAFIELKTQYCDHKFCLRCAVGNALLKS
ncbi:MAG: DUF2851 family protein [Flavisolibacter sp.]|jgi:hypothetical protein